MNSNNTRDTNTQRQSELRIEKIFPSITKNPIFCKVDFNSAYTYLNEASMLVRFFNQKEVAYSSTAEGVCIGILLSGKAQVYTGSANDPILLKSLKAGELFGIANLYAEEEPFPTMIITTEPCEILFINGEAFKSFIENDTVALRNYLSFQSKKIVYLNHKIMTFTAPNAEKKLAVFLLDHEQNLVYTPSCSMSALADMLGIGRASLYRGMDHLIEHGWIEKKGKKIYIKDRDALLGFI